MGHHVKPGRTLSEARGRPNSSHGRQNSSADIGPLSQTRLCIDVTTSAAHWKFDADVKRWLPAAENIKMSHAFIEFTVPQKYDTDHFSDSVESTPYFQILQVQLHFNIILPPISFPGFRIKTLYEFLIFFVHTTCPANLIFLCDGQAAANLSSATQSMPSHNPVSHWSKYI